MPVIGPRIMPPQAATPPWQPRVTGVGDDASGPAAAGTPGGRPVQGGEDGPRSGAVAPARKPDGTPLTEDELRQLALLKKIDAKVRAHEMAHLAAAGPYARGGASFQYRRGPDGRNYAVGGEVPIDTSKEATPEETIAKMQIVRAAALAPADPSPQDLKVAGAASAAISEAKKEMQMQELDARLRAVQRGEGENGRSYPAAGAADRYQATAEASGAQPPSFSRFI